MGDVRASALDVGLVHHLLRRGRPDVQRLVEGAERRGGDVPAALVDGPQQVRLALGGPLEGVRPLLVRLVRDVHGDRLPVADAGRRALPRGAERLERPGAGGESVAPLRLVGGLGTDGEISPHGGSELPWGLDAAPLGLRQADRFRQSTLHPLPRADLSRCPGSARRPLVDPRGHSGPPRHDRRTPSPRRVPRTVP